MGTRSITLVRTSEGVNLLNMYRQFDGYLDGHGRDLFELLDGMKIVNGMTGRNTKQANGAGCLAAQIVSNFKKEAGGIYIYPIDSGDCGQDYTYCITVTEESNWTDPRIAGDIHISVNSYGEEIFSGSVKEFGEKIDSGEGDEE